MKVQQIPITSGPAGGTLVTEVRDDSDRRLGFIRVVNCDWTPILGGSTVYIAKQCYTGDTLEESRYQLKAFETLMDAYLFLGVPVKEQDESDLGEYPYSEKIPDNYWKTHKIV